MLVRFQLGAQLAQASREIAVVVQLVDTHASEACPARVEGSSPSHGTEYYFDSIVRRDFIIFRRFRCKHGRFFE